MIDLYQKNLLTLSEYSSEEIDFLLHRAAQLKADKYLGREKRMLEGKNIALIFEKDSTRTRCACEVAAYDQGAHVTYLGATGSQMSKKESTRDTARVLGRMYDGLFFRGHQQQHLQQLADCAGIPVWNALTDQHHPTQALADLMTLREHAPKPLNQVKLCFLGDARNNVATSLMVGAAKMGVDFRAVSPPQLAPDTTLIKECRSFALRSGAKITMTDDVAIGVQDCDFIYTDVWLSMGESEALWAQRIKELQPYRVNGKVMKLTGNPDARFMHCLPACHNTQTELGRMIEERFGLTEMEVTDEVFESAGSVVFDQAENRIHTLKALMISTLTQH